MLAQVNFWTVTYLISVKIHLYIDKTEQFRADFVKWIVTVPCFIVEKSMIQLSSHNSFCFWYLNHYKRQTYELVFYYGVILNYFMSICSYQSRQYEAEAEQAERQADGQLGSCGHRAFTTVSRTGGTKLRLLTNSVTTHWGVEKRMFTLCPPPFAE